MGGTVSRPLERNRTVDIAYTRPRRRTDRPPVVLLPGGPGMASVLPYRVLRRRAVRRELDVIMMEHRGVGLSRRDTEGVDLPVEAVTVEAAADDLAAVLDHEGVDRAVVYGSSYGSYLAAVFGVRHPDRVAGMVLDSPVLSASDVDTVRAHRRRLLWHGESRTAALLRELLESGRVPMDEVGHVVQVTYEFAGPATVERLLEARMRGHALRTWRRLASLGAKEIAGEGIPLMLDIDLVAGITHGVLGYGAEPDGLPLDPQAMFAEAAAKGPAFTGDTVDLPRALGEFSWPTAVVSGGRDLRTPRPIAERAVSLLPDAVLVELPENGHSALDTHQLAALHVAHHLVEGNLHGLTRHAPRIAELPRRGSSASLGPLIVAALAAELATDRVTHRRC